MEKAKKKMGEKRKEIRVENEKNALKRERVPLKGKRGGGKMGKR